MPVDFRGIRRFVQAVAEQAPAERADVLERERGEDA
jgi:hypothetical protein